VIYEVYWYIYVKILVLENKNNNKILKINVQATCGIKNLTLYIYINK